MRFSIRDLLLVTVIVALAVGWWVDRSRLASGITLHEREINFLEHENEFQDRAMLELAEKVRELKKLLPTSQAPTPNPPKD